MRQLGFVLLIILISLNVFASEPFYVFHSDAEKITFDHITHNVRCVVCHGQSIADSNASLAIDLKRKIYQQIQSGMNEQEIKHYLLSRYGDSILLDPPFKNATIILWSLPFLMLVAGWLVIMRIMRASKMR